MSVGIFPLEIEANADYSALLTWTDQNNTPINLTGYSAKLEIASDYDTNPSRTVYWTLASAGMSPEITFPTPTTSGQIQLLIPAADVQNFTFPKGVYDLLLTGPGGNVIKLLKGPVVVAPGVTMLP